MARYQLDLDLQAAVLDSPPPAPSPFTTPSRPDCALLEIIHRRHDGYITFHRETAAGWQDLVSIPANALPGLFEQLVPLAESDSFFSINGMYRGAWSDNNHGLIDQAGTPLKKPARRREHARWLTCAFADLDCHSLGIDVGTAIGSIINAQDEGIIPPASVLTRSGRGVWAFWIITGQDYKQPREHAAAYGNCVELWSFIQGALGHRLAKLNSDFAALDISRVCRIPGSVNTKARFRVGYWIQADQAGNIPKYTLTELADLLGVKKIRKPAAPTLNRVVTIYQQRASKGQAGRWLKAKQQFDQLADLRHTFKAGTRNSAVFVLTTILRCLPGTHKLTDQEIDEALENLFQRCEQSPTRYTRQELRDTAAAAGNRLAKIRNQTIADLLEITPDESAILGVWPPAKRHATLTDQAEPLTAPEVAVRRRAIIENYINRTGSVPTLAVLREVVEAAGLELPAKATIRTDLIAIGKVNPRRHRKLPPSGQGKLPI